MHTIIGVRGRLVDFAVDVRVMADLADPTYDALVCLEYGQRRAGKYDGAMRDRYCLRYLRHAQMDELPHAAALITVTDDAASVAVQPTDDFATVRTYARLRFAADPHNLVRIIGRHLTSWYGFLQADPQITQACNQWAASDAAALVATGGSITTLNRSADRYLYALAVAQGWTKLTMGARIRLGFGSAAPQWQRTDAVIAAAAERRAYRLQSEASETGTPPEWLEAAERLEERAS